LENVDRSIAVFSAVYLVGVITLAIIGNKQPDVYVTLSALIYFVYISVDDALRRSIRLMPISMIVFAAFIVAVIYRLSTMLG